MFPGTIVGLAFAAMFAGVFIMMLADKFKWRWLETAGVSVSLVASVYCVVAAIFLLADWQDPFAAVNMTANELGRASASGRGRGGLVILAIKYWPYVLGGSGIYFAYNAALILYSDIRRATRSV